MDIKGWMIVAIVLIVVIIVICLFVLKYSYFDLFCRRLKPYQPVYNVLKTKYPDFSCTKHDYVNDKGIKIAGAFYYYPHFKTFKGLIINAHGMDNCKETQLSRLEYFARDGYLIYSYDGTGVGESEGKDIVGLGHSVIDLYNTIKHLETIDVINDMKWALYGHSWGGYAVSCVGNYPFNHPIDVIIAKAGFNSVRDEFKFQGYQKIGKITNLFLPLVMMIENLRLPANKNKFSVDALAKTNAEVLIMHSVDDHMVGFESVMKKYIPRLYNHENIHWKIYQNRGHVIDQETTSLGRYYSNHGDDTDPKYEQHYATLLVKDMDHELVKEQLSFLNEYMVNK